MLTTVASYLISALMLGGCGDGSCCEANNSPGCDDSDCCDVVCEMDDYCCTQFWDLFCAEAASELCDIDECCIGDINNNGVVDLDDVIIVKENFGPCPQPPSPCPGDFNGDGIVDGADIGIVLRNFGPCDEPGGTEGCTPGYWKQKHHFDSWPEPYDPYETLFSDVFEDAFPGRTLHQVLRQGGGGLKALGRHTVAALLNAASDGVDYGPTESDVITMFNFVYLDGEGEAYEELKDMFEMYNEMGCPLN